MALPASPFADVLRDKDHYHPTGDSIIRVENTLFKVHKLFLIHNSPVFATMFDLPVRMGSLEGSSDDWPIVLEGEKAEDLRAVLKYIYAPPIRVQIHSMTIAAIPEMISVAKFSHKYEMDHWKEWALEVLAPQLVDPNYIPVDHIPALHTLYNLLGDTSTRGRIMKHWCQVVERDDLSILPILTAADASEDRNALVDIYCIQIRRWENSTNVLGPQSFAQGGVGPTHFQRILSGYTSLSLLWNRLRSHQIPHPFQNAHCRGGYDGPDHDTQCVPYFRKQWTEAIMDAEHRYPHITQMSSRLSCVGERLHKQNSTDPYYISEPEMIDCFSVVIKRFKKHVQNDTGSLAGHFFPESQVASTK
ncbi:BTB domain-containing protein [Mycena sanguinolenta]|uniref:BTB domain-containing protein n=1 Tax=Mycena sanguinolenta TaxID=230812 RepID=A0A8H6XHY2_9AGAR|nr:BTB domain-containing protein [Mycena sanguinolenta]